MQTERKKRYPHTATVNSNTLHIFRPEYPQPGIPTFGQKEPLWRSICNKVSVRGVHKATQKELTQKNLCGLCKRIYRPEIHDV